MKNTEAGKATRRVQLKNMPFDRFEDGVGFIHATGYDCLVDGQWMTEYEDNIFEDAAGCSYEVEPEEEPEWTEEDEANGLKLSSRIRDLKNRTRRGKK